MHSQFDYFSIFFACWDMEVFDKFPHRANLVSQTLCSALDFIDFELLHLLITRIAVCLERLLWGKERLLSGVVRMLLILAKMSWWCAHGIHCLFQWHQRLEHLVCDYFLLLLRVLLLLLLQVSCSCEVSVQQFKHFVFYLGVWLTDRSLLRECWLLKHWSRFDWRRIPPHWSRSGALTHAANILLAWIHWHWVWSWHLLLMLSKLLAILCRGLVCLCLGHGNDLINRHMSDLRCWRGLIRHLSYWQVVQILCGLHHVGLSSGTTWWHIGKLLLLACRWILNDSTSV